MGQPIQRVGVTHVIIKILVRHLVLQLLETPRALAVNAKSVFLGRAACTFSRVAYLAQAPEIKYVQGRLRFQLKAKWSEKGKLTFSTKIKYLAVWSGVNISRNLSVVYSKFCSSYMNIVLF